MFAQPGGEWTTLFDGSTLDGWNVIGDGTWTLVDGAVEGDGEAGFLVTAESFSDFQLTFEFWIGEDSNSGVFIRCSDPEQRGSTLRTRSTSPTRSKTQISDRAPS